MQAQRSLGNTKQNPSVGCVIVKNSSIVGTGFTSFGGTPHAEVNAIKSAKKNASNSDLFVTLEPCSHYAKTPPCTKYIIQNKIKKVFFSINDPDSRSFNKSSKKLRKNGIFVNKGAFRKEINFFYRSYLKFKKKNLPFVTSKLAISKDFYTISKNNEWITNKFSRGRVHLLRSYHDCIMTSSETIINDNPQLTCRINGLNNRSPSRIVLDNKLKISINSKIVKESSIFHTIVFYNKNNKQKIKLLKKLNVKLYKISLDKDGKLDLIKLLFKTKKLGFSRVFLESGIRLTTSFLKRDLIDDFKLFISSKNLGKSGSGNIKKYLRFFLKNKKKVIEKVNLYGEKLISYKLK